MTKKKKIVCISAASAVLIAVLVTVVILVILPRIREAQFDKKIRTMEDYDQEVRILYKIDNEVRQTVVLSNSMLGSESEYRLQYGEYDEVMEPVTMIVTEDSMYLDSRAMMGELGRLLLGDMDDKAYFYDLYDSIYEQDITKFSRAEGTEEPLSNIRNRWESFTERELTLVQKITKNKSEDNGPYRLADTNGIVTLLESLRSEADENLDAYYDDITEFCISYGESVEGEAGSVIADYGLMLRDERDERLEKLVRQIHDVLDMWQEQVAVENATLTYRTTEADGVLTRSFVFICGDQEFDVTLKWHDSFQAAIQAPEEYAEADEQASLLTTYFDETEGEQINNFQRKESE